MSLNKTRSRFLQRLQHRKHREQEGCFVVEGVRAASAALDAGADIRFAVTSPRLETLDQNNQLITHLADGDFETTSVDEKDFAALANTVTPQGILLVCTKPAMTLDSLLPADKEPGGRILVADAIQDPANLASMIRTSAAFGLDGLVVLEGTVDPWNAKVVRGSAGGCFRIKIVGATAKECLDWIQNSSVILLAAEVGGGDIAAVRFPMPWALVVGNEGSGIRPEFRAAAHESVSVPICCEAESLNAGVATAILCYEMTQWNRQ